MCQSTKAVIQNLKTQGTRGLYDLVAFQKSDIYQVGLELSHFIKYQLMNFQRIYFKYT